MIQTDENKKYFDILKTAISLIAVDGVDAVTIVNVGHKLKVSNTTIYRHFKDRHEIISNSCKYVHYLYYEGLNMFYSNARTNEERVASLIEGSFSEDIFTKEYIHTWLAYWTYMPYKNNIFDYSGSLYKTSLDRSNEIFSNIGVANESAISSFWIFIDGLWLRAAVSPPVFGREQAIKMAYDYAEALIGKDVRQSGLELKARVDLGEKRNTSMAQLHARP